MSDLVDIRGLDHADVLAALYNASFAQNMGLLHYTPEPMTREEAARLLATGEQDNAGFPPDKKGVYFDYLKGRVLKVLIGGNTLDPRLYDRDNGPGAAARAIDTVRKTPVADQGVKT